MNDFSPEVARELYPVALRQARAGVVLDLIMAAVIAIGAVVLLVVGAPAALCLTASAVAEYPVVVRGIKRFKRLRSMRPIEAASSGEL